MVGHGNCIASPRGDHRGTCSELGDHVWPLRRRGFKGKKDLLLNDILRDALRLPA
jgi:hypothetical protein